MSRVKGLVPRLPRQAWLILGGDTLSAAGTGLTLPFLFVYLSRVRGMSLAITGLAVSAIAVASFAGNTIGGWLSDRIGSRRTLMIGTVFSALGAAGLVLVRAPWQAFITTATLGLGNSVSWPAQDALLATAVPIARSDVYSVRHATYNAGLGIGMLAAAAVADIARPSSFVVLYLIDAATFLSFVPLLLFLRGVGDAPARPPSDQATKQASGYRAVLADKVFVRVWILSVMLMVVGYGTFNAAFPAFAARPGGIGAKALALATAANTVGVVVMQLLVLNVVRGKRRTRAIVALCAFWAAFWTITLLGGRLGGSSAAVATFAFAAVVFAVGETLLGPTLRPIVNDLAPDDLRGRYNGASMLAWTTGFMIGPIVAGFALGNGWSTQLFTGLVVVSGFAAVLALRLESVLPSAINVVSTGEAESDGEVFVAPPIAEVAE